MVAARAEKKDRLGLQFVRNKWVLNFISPFDRFWFLEVFCPGISFPWTDNHLTGLHPQPLVTFLKILKWGNPQPFSAPLLEVPALSKFITFQS